MRSGVVVPDSHWWESGTRARPLSDHQTRVALDADPNLDAVMRTLDARSRGRIPDPCRGASFMWASPWMEMNSRRVDCGDTANRFYELPAVLQRTVVERLAGGDDCVPPPHTPQ